MCCMKDTWVLDPGATWSTCGCDHAECCVKSPNTQWKSYAHRQEGRPGCEDIQKSYHSIDHGVALCCTLVLLRLHSSVDLG